MKMSVAYVVNRVVMLEVEYCVTLLFAPTHGVPNFQVGPRRVEVPKDLTRL